MSKRKTKRKNMKKKREEDEVKIKKGNLFQRKNQHNTKKREHYVLQSVKQMKIVMEQKYVRMVYVQKNIKYRKIVDLKQSERH